MDENSPRAQGPEPFRALLMPHRSLSQRGFLLIMAGIITVSFAAGIAFWIAGAWPVMGFFGLDVVLVYAAFKLNYRSGRLHELVEVSPGETTVTRVHPSGRKEVFTFVTAWVRVVLDERTNGQTELKLRHRAEDVTFASFLNDDERREFATALTGALLRIRRPDFTQSSVLP
jgi:uncharacterized membrane protein